MKIARELSDAEAKKVQTFILLGGVFTTLAIWTKLEDPINLPKMFVLVLSAAIVLGLALPGLLISFKSATGSQKIGLSLILFFAIALLVSTITTDVKYTAIFGEYHRNNGALSYFAMAILLAGAALTFSRESAIRYFRFFALTGLLLTGYGFLQAVGKDPVGWKLDYNPFITTLGNPNFTSAFLGLAGIAILFLAIQSKDRKCQIIYASGLLADLYILIRSGSIQGIYGFLIGSTIIVVMKLWLINKKFGQISLILAAIGATPVALAVLNVGPLANKLYQGTLRNRLDYWNAAIAMFKDHPIFGVGIDRFGDYYRQYAVQNQVVQGQITDNAHSVYMQILATGGLVLFIPYLALIVYVTYAGLKAMFKANDNEQLLIGGVLAIWLGTLAINIVAIDNLGVAVWFWITGGVLIASPSNADVMANSLHYKNNKNKVKSRKPNGTESLFPVNYAASFMLAFGVLLITVPALGKSSTLYNLKNNASSYITESYIATLDSESKSARNDPQYLIQLANLALIQNAANEAFSMIDQINRIDSRSYYGNYFAAIALEALNKRSDAIKYRERLKELDPWNNASLIELAKDYLAVGNRDSAASIVALIKKNYPGSQSDMEAAALLVG